MTNKLHITLCMAALASMSAWAQYNPNDMSYGSPASIANEININNDYNSRVNRAAAQAEADRQWWEEENRIQADIRRLRKKPFYGAILFQPETNRYKGGAGFSSKELAINTLMRNCSNCTVLATFANTCAMAASPDGIKGNINAISVAFDKDGQKAIEKAYYACEAKYGKGNCSYGGLNKEGDGPGTYAYCSGYDYGVYKE